jgi:acetyl-CoA carboxylase biotin carboxylase subunit
MFSKLLVANRGEIALRIVRACRDLGITSVAIYSDVDLASRHVRKADEAYCIGGATARESYLDMEKIIAVARKAGADAIHPGYGFLAENADFAELCEKSGITFVGPSAHSIRLMGDKIAARQTVREAGVPVVPGSDEISNLDDAHRFALEIGLPVMIKAAAGGGGKGIRIVEADEDLERSLRMAMAEAEAAFGRGDVYVEKYLAPVRHVEIQIIADRYGNVISLGERECSIQRRHQKIIEEAPSPAVDADLRRAMSRAAVRAARAANYHNIGTIEFLLAADNSFYFLEMNTRLQVEHPVTEMVSGVDLVADQILMAAGQELTYEPDDLRYRGWAIECRLVAEDPYNNFLPSVGHVLFAREPGGPGVRVESSLYDGLEVSPYYDALLAKVTAWGRTRDEAIARMKRALAETRVYGVATNIPFLIQIMDDPDFVAGRIDTSFLETHDIQPLASEEEEQEGLAAIAAALIAATGKTAVNGSTAPSSTSQPNGRAPAPSGWKTRGNTSGWNASGWRRSS